MFWRNGKGVEDGSWHGPARVLMTEGANLIWISHLTRLYRCGPEHVRCLSQDENDSLTPEEKSQSLQLPARCGNGVFQFHELSQQPPLDSARPQNTNHNGPIITDQIINSTPNVAIPIPQETPPASVTQPDDEPENNSESQPNAETNAETPNAESLGTIDPTSSEFPDSNVQST